MLALRYTTKSQQQSSCASCHVLGAPPIRPRLPISELCSFLIPLTFCLLDADNYIFFQLLHIHYKAALCWMGVLFIGCSKEMKWAILNVEEHQSRAVYGWTFARSLIFRIIIIMIYFQAFWMIPCRSWCRHFIFCHPDRSHNSEGIFFLSAFALPLSSPYIWPLQLVKGLLLKWRSGHG